MVSQLFDGRQPITLDLAKKLEVSLNVPAQFWVRREERYRKASERKHTSLTREAGKKWLQSLPISDMKKLGWLEVATNNDMELLIECLRFFDEQDIDGWNVTYSEVPLSTKFRTSVTYKSKVGSVAAWLRQGEILADKVDCNSWNPRKFVSTLSSIRTLTKCKSPNVFLPNLKRLCASCGIAVVVVKTPTGCAASGAVQFVGPNKAMLLLSFRYLSDDHFWFTFFHEAGHLVLHSKEDLILESDENSNSAMEQEANEFAEKLLIPPDRAKELEVLRPNAKSVIRFAVQIGVSPGIVVGQLQHRRLISMRQLNYLKRRYDWNAL